MSKFSSILVYVLVVVTALAAGFSYKGYSNRKADVAKILDQHEKLRDKDKKIGTQLREISALRDEVHKQRNEVAQAKADLEAKTTELVAAVEEREKAMDELTKKSDELEDTKKKLEIALQNTGTPGQPGEFAQPGKVKELEDLLAASNIENRILTGKVREYEEYMNQLFPDRRSRVQLPETARGKVVAVDKKWNFVVLDFGKDKGALPGGELVVYREGKLLGKISLVNVEDSTSTADILNDWKIGVIQPGDLVMSSNS